MSEQIYMEGRCGCGQTTWKSTSIATHLDFCYCTQCQQVTGSAFGTWMGIDKKSITWDGSPAKYRISELATRSLCVQCGGTLNIQYECYPGKTHVAAGTLTKGADLLPKQPSCHIFVRSKPVWYTIPDDGVPKWEEFDDEFKQTLHRYELRVGKYEQRRMG